MLCQITYNGEVIAFDVKRKRIKNLNLRVKSDGSIHVSAPFHSSDSQVEAFVMAQVPFIQRARWRWAQHRAQKSPPLQYVTGETLYVLGRPVRLVVEPLCGRKRSQAVFNGNHHLYLYVPDQASYAYKYKVMMRFWKTLGERVFIHWLNQVHTWFSQRGYQVPYPALRQRSMKSRWGSCTPGRASITMNIKLLEGPEAYIEYVMVHEMAHFIQANHSPAFHAIVAEFLPDWKARKRALNDYFRNRI